MQKIYTVYLTNKNRFWYENGKFEAKIFLRPHYGEQKCKYETDEVKRQSQHFWKAYKKLGLVENREKKFDHSKILYTTIDRLEWKQRK